MTLILVETVVGTVQIVQEDDYVEISTEEGDFVAKGDMIRIAEGSIFCIAGANSVWSAELS